MSKVNVPAVGYARVSTVAQATEGESLDVQAEAIRAYAKVHGLKLLKNGMVRDEGVSGKKWSDRAGLQEVLSHARNGDVQAVVVYSMSRLGRSARELLNIIADLEALGVAVHFCKEQLDPSTMVGRLMRTILAAFSEWELETIAERMASGLAARRARGIPTSSNVTYGYTYHGNQVDVPLMFTVNPDEAAVLHRVATWLLSEGLSVGACCARLDRDGVGTPKGFGPWRTHSLCLILRNPLLYGIVRDKDKQYGQLAESVFTRPVWERLQSAITAKTKTRNLSDDGRDFLLRNLLFCGSCPTGDGDDRQYAAMTAVLGKLAKTGKGRYPGSYQCFYGRSPKLAAAHGRDCTSYKVPRSTVDDTMWEFAKRALLDPTVFVERFLNDLGGKDKLDAAQKALADLDRELAKVKRQQSVLYADKLAEKVPAHVADSTMAKLERGRLGLVGRHDQVRAEVEALSKSMASKELLAKAGNLSKAVADAAGLLDDLPNADKSALIRTVLGDAKLIVRVLDHDRMVATMQDRKDAGLARPAKAVKGTGSVADELRTIGQVAHFWPQPGRGARKVRADRAGGWRLYLSGVLDVAGVIDGLATFAMDKLGTKFPESQKAGWCS
ncbi:hypothetical protein LCGC14_1745570 [marine sediment metagenome]|uniref:Resolvase/invertase-type recombinase catalytic domain-containing protein n=1 Tax=marine sediment metagenome TaxID=412755 RepID=A0A0F9H5H2_9ZZZZ